MLQVTHTPPPRNKRLLALYGIVGLVMAIFLARLWQLQVTEADAYRARAASNRLRAITSEAPRGILYDRNGIMLARNTPTYDVAIVPGFLPDDEAAVMKVYGRLSELLDLPVTGRTASLAGAGGARGIKDLVDEAGGLSAFRPVTIKSDVPRDVALLIREESAQLPGVSVEVVSTREYPLGRLTSHLVGYTGRVPVDVVDRMNTSMVDLLADTRQAALLRFFVDAQAARHYDPDKDRIGLTGAEAAYDDWLRGQKGERVVEEDVAGREIRMVGPVIQPTPGHNAYLTIDRDLQQVAYEALQAQIDRINSYAGALRTRRGAAIAMDPRNGQVLALVSLPTFDNNLFARGISAEEYDSLLVDPFLPLLNHAIGDQVPPGSTFKIIPAAAALQEAIITPRWTYFDAGSIVIPNQYFPDDPRQATTFYNWYRPGFGNTNLELALAQSVDTYFYVVGGGLDVPGQRKVEGLGLKKLVEWQKLFGLGAAAGIDLPGEAPAHVVDAQWKRLNYGENWSTGDTYNLSIGQGYALATPLQMLSAYAAVANGGTLYRPQTVLKITDADGTEVRAFQPEVIRELPISPENLQVVRQGLEAAVAYGTATGAQVGGMKVAGKTGTAEFCDDLAQKLGYCAAGRVKPSHAWFVAYAPADDPQIAVIVYIYNGGEGSQAAVPVVQQILQYWHDRQIGATPAPQP